MTENQNQEPLQLTCLHDKHVALGAKMSPFAGFDMPIQYGSIITEHQAVRGKAGIFDVSHMGEIFVEGPDAERFVNHIFTNEVRGMEPGKILYGMMCWCTARRREKSISSSSMRPTSTRISPGSRMR